MEVFLLGIHRLSPGRQLRTGTWSTPVWFRTSSWELCVVTLAPLRGKADSPAKSVLGFPPCGFKQGAWMSWPIIVCGWESYWFFSLRYLLKEMEMQVVSQSLMILSFQEVKMYLCLSSYRNFKRQNSSNERLIIQFKLQWVYYTCKYIKAKPLNVLIVLFLSTRIFLENNRDINVRKC